MRNEKVFEWLSEKGFADRVIDHTETIDTVEHAAIQLGCSEAEIVAWIMALGTVISVFVGGTVMHLFFDVIGFEPRKLEHKSLTESLAQLFKKV